MDRLCASSAAKAFPVSSPAMRHIKRSLDTSEPLQNGQNKVLNGRPNLPDKDRRCDAAAGAARQAGPNHGPLQAAHGFPRIFLFF
jgi:hypothetical protein